VVDPTGAIATGFLSRHPGTVCQSARVLPISELVRVTASCDDSWHCPLADRAARLWRLPPDLRPVFVRSSANHVFVAGPVVLRLRPVGTGTDAAAAWSSALADDGAAVARAVPSRTGVLTERVRWSGTDYAVSAYERVEGEVRESDVTQNDVRAWGAGLATLHEAPTDGTLLPSWPARARAVGADAALRDLPRDPPVFGAVHGDPELDNVVWSPERGPVFVDLDDAARGWRVADVAFALRDFAPVGAAPDLTDERVATFVAGYREVRPLTDLELSWLPALSRAHAAIELARLQPVLAEPVGPAWPDWASALADRVASRAAQLMAALAEPGT
jgi:Ser/Thr protein kinase RdoA (MazF antagonist)